MRRTLRREQHEDLEHTMRKILMTISATAIAAAAIASPTKVEARCWGCGGWGWGGAGLAAGVIGGALISRSAFGYWGAGGYSGYCAAGGLWHAVTIAVGAAR